MHFWRRTTFMINCLIDCESGFFQFAVLRFWFKLTQEKTNRKPKRPWFACLLCQHVFGCMHSQQAIKCGPVSPVNLCVISLQGQVPSSKQGIVQVSVEEPKSNFQTSVHKMNNCEFPRNKWFALSDRFLKIGSPPFFSGCLLVICCC